MSAESFLMHICISLSSFVHIFAVAASNHDSGQLVRFTLVMKHNNLVLVEGLRCNTTKKVTVGLTALAVHHKFRHTVGNEHPACA